MKLSQKKEWMEDFTAEEIEDYLEKLNKSETYKNICDAAHKVSLTPVPPKGAHMFWNCTREAHFIEKSLFLLNIACATRDLEDKKE